MQLEIVPISETYIPVLYYIYSTLVQLDVVKVD